jgi:hypothetical protein
MNARRAKSTERDEHLESDAREASASPEPALRREFGDVLSLQRTIGNRRTAALMVQRIKLQDMRERSARMHEMGGSRHRCSRAAAAFVRVSRAFPG